MLPVVNEQGIYVVRCRSSDFGHSGRLLQFWFPKLAARWSYDIGRHIQVSLYTFDLFRPSLPVIA
jgi:hypothetical protein